jgi:hypothetical protein
MNDTVKEIYLQNYSLYAKELKDVCVCMCVCVCVYVFECLLSYLSELMPFCSEVFTYRMPGRSSGLKRKDRTVSDLVLNILLISVIS